MNNHTYQDSQITTNSATVWVAEILQLHQSEGRTLTEAETKIALDVGVAYPDNIWIIVIDQVPAPDIDILAKLRIQNGLQHSHTSGLALGYIVFLKNGLMNNYLLAHEFRHVYQFEKIGSIERMILLYIQEIIKFGYQNAPLEMDAVKASSAYF
ncbi:hypothetical protein [Methylotenera sp.]|uniref:hypothetical protein n=1 Tax=Methylotenera sp. TaxID=2051956 RepID=UPI002735F4A7|nr:hypothetical protein [Methylotenera sp.]MDP3211931.1 hypothetical protein [Methylotenera sp.]